MCSYLSKCYPAIVRSTCVYNSLSFHSFALFSVFISASVSVSVSVAGTRFNLCSGQITIHDRALCETSAIINWWCVAVYACVLVFSVIRRHPGVVWRTHYFDSAVAEFEPSVRWFGADFICFECQCVSESIDRCVCWLSGGYCFLTNWWFYSDWLYVDVT